MVEPADIPRILLDAARLLGRGEIVVFGSASLAFWLDDPPRTRDIDLWCTPAEGGDVLVALMGELSWYQDKHGAYVEVWGPETFTAPGDWRSRARTLHDDTVTAVSLVVPHPHDVLVAKLERWSPSDQAHGMAILRDFPLTADTLQALANRCPFRAEGGLDGPRRVAFEIHLTALLDRMAAGAR